MGGVVIGSRKAETDLLVYRKDCGGSIAPDAAWHILVYGIPSLAMRIGLQQTSSIQIAQFLEQHSNVKCVRYPGLKARNGYFRLARGEGSKIYGSTEPGYSTRNPG